MKWACLLKNCVKENCVCAEKIIVSFTFRLFLSLSLIHFLLLILFHLIRSNLNRKRSDISIVLFHSSSSTILALFIVSKLNWNLHSFVTYISTFIKDFTASAVPDSIPIMIEFYNSHVRKSSIVRYRNVLKHKTVSIQI